MQLSCLNIDVKNGKYCPTQRTIIRFYKIMYKNIQQELFMNSLKQSYKQYHQDKLMQIKYMYMYICIYHQTNKFNVKRITRKVVLTFL